jgi:hypothetical protein
MGKVKKIPIKVYDQKKEKEVTAGLYDGVVFTKMAKEKHFMRMFNGYGIQEEALQKLKELGCQRVIIKTNNDGNYYSLLDDWFQCEVRQFGNGQQRFLDRRFMVIK